MLRRSTLAALVVVVVAGLTAGLEWRRLHARATLAWREILDEMQLMDAAIRAHELSLVDAQETKLHAATEQLRAVRFITPARSARLDAAVATLAIAAADTHTAADAGDARGAALELRHTRRVLDQVRALLPADLGKMSSLARLFAYACPMHPDVQSERPGPCPRCGMALEPRDRETRAPYVTMRASADGRLRVGERAHVLLELRRPDGAPLIMDDLLEAHTRKIHVLIVDESLVDYHHVHPSPTRAPGRYEFEFTPRKPGSYRVWADLLPAATQVQELPTADLAGSAPGETLPDRAARLVDVVDGLRYELIPAAALTKDMPTGLQLSITQDGRPFARLEPIMGTYAHLVAFSADRGTVAHLHPIGMTPHSDGERGSSPLELVFVPRVSGVMVMFAQVQIGGESRFARFVLDVGTHIAAITADRR